MAVKKTDVVPAKGGTIKGGKAQARRMESFRERAESISRELAGRRHSDSAALLAEDRKR
ncbi:MAG: hypothetical protein LC800_21530 [Acidobacteria bacterium]|nr:hypothetical protein [Acidobacteriota bacterium]